MFEKTPTNKQDKGKLLRLIHPIYLDVPMLVSFAAALQGGVAFGSEITEQISKEKKKNKNLRGQLGLNDLFSQLFNVSLAAESSAQLSDAKNQIRTESKSHTESSIAIILYDQLCRNEEQLFKPKQLTDIDKLEPGMLVELEGVVEKNAIDAIIDYLETIKILITLDTSQKQQQIRKSQKEFEKFKDTLDQDRKRTPISTMLLKCSKPIGLNAAITLRTENLRDLTLSELNKNEVKVVGKVTRVIFKGDSMSAFENYGLSMANPKLLEEIFEDLKNTEDINIDVGAITIPGPALQVLPLMIFV